MSRPLKIRLSKYLADCGIWSRRKCGDLITSGRIKVDGQKITDLSFKVSGSSKVLLDGQLIKPEEKIVVALNKPPGYLSTASDEFGRKTVLDLVKNIKVRLYPAGRLDMDSSGLIILTNDGELVYNITHPKFMIPKTYQLTISRNISKTNNIFIFLDSPRVVLGTFSDPFLIILKSCLDRFGIILESFWHNFGIF